MLALENISVTWDDFTLTADLAVEAGETVAVIGPSGAGKSTLLAAIAGFLPLVSGRITWEGRDLSPLSPGDRPISILFQDQNLFPHLTIAENIGLGLNPALRLTAGDRARVEQALERTGLAGLGHRRPGQLSGGQQSRAALARVLLRARPLFLLDEPFSALGPALKAEMLDLVAEIAAETGATVLMVSHDPGDARRIAARTILVEGGRAHPPEPTGRLLDHPPESLRAYLGN
ncbi:ATP-binding cassette domain-containing protein [Ostreiculturibacter nitratireducens]|uniref:thiamine ABC transporter ATP-binding protein n=1 Tax=Ostreiculturibacter nitratireducens TaxID=3075226 RepID=UPI0031B5D9AF